MKCGTHPDYLVPGCDDCVRAGYAEQLAKDKRDVQAGLDIDRGLASKTIDFLESLGRWTMDQKRCLSFAQRRRLDEILGAHYGPEEP